MPDDKQHKQADVASAPEHNHHHPDTVTIGMILDAYSNNRQYVKKTPLIRAEMLEELFDGAEIYLKPENLQYTGSFKVRGVTNKMLSLSGAELARGVASASSGNHAMAVAYMSARLGVKSVIVMPENAPAVKIEGAKKYGAEIVLYGFTGDDREQKCDELIRKHNYCLVHPFADTILIAGHGSLAIEAADQMREIMSCREEDGTACCGNDETTCCGKDDTPRRGNDETPPRNGKNDMPSRRDFDEIVIPCGAGSIVSGIAVAAKNYMPGTLVTAV
jgi:threonine dehydratase